MDPKDTNNIFSIDWKSSLEEVILILSPFVPSLTLEFLGEEKQGEDWYEKASINNIEVRYRQENHQEILSFIHDINTHLAQEKQVILYRNVRDDNLEFILLDTPYPKSFRDNNFIEIT